MSCRYREDASQIFKSPMLGWMSAPCTPWAMCLVPGCGMPCLPGPRPEVCAMHGHGVEPRAAYRDSGAPCAQLPRGCWVLCVEVCIRNPHTLPERRSGGAQNFRCEGVIAQQGQGCRALFSRLGPHEAAAALSMDRSVGDCSSSSSRSTARAAAVQQVLICSPFPRGPPCLGGKVPVLEDLRQDRQRHTRVPRDRIHDGLRILCRLLLPPP